MIKDVAFPSEGATLRGLLFLPESQTKRPPLFIMAHGTSATVTMVADKYAEVFSRAGLAVLLYDHRNFGRSDGEPRQEINPWIQCRGYRDAVKFAERLDGVDRERIALWGDSYTGGQVIVVGVIEQRVKVIVAQCPVFGAEPPAVQPSSANFDLIKEILRGVMFVCRPRRQWVPYLLSPSTKPAHRRYSSPSRRSAGSLTTEVEPAPGGLTVPPGCCRQRRCLTTRRCALPSSRRPRC